MSGAKVTDIDGVSRSLGDHEKRIRELEKQRYTELEETKAEWIYGITNEDTIYEVFAIDEDPDHRVGRPLLNQWRSSVEWTMAGNAAFQHDESDSYESGALYIYEAGVYLVGCSVEWANTAANADLEKYGVAIDFAHGPSTEFYLDHFPTHGGWGLDVIDFYVGEDPPSRRVSRDYLIIAVLSPTIQGADVGMNLIWDPTVTDANPREILNARMGIVKLGAASGAGFISGLDGGIGV